MPPPSRERISGVDTAWLRMDQPTNLMMIVGVMRLEGRPALAAVRRAIGARFLSFRRFRCRVVQDAAGAWWEETETDLAKHVVRARLGGARGKEELEALVSELASTPLDPARPLWQFVLVDNFAGGAALITRIHHCYADGIALIQVMLSMTDADAAASLALAAQAGDAAPAPADDFLSQILQPVAGALEGARDVGKDLLEQGRRIAERPAIAADALQELAGKGAGIAQEAARLILMGSDADTRLKGALGVQKRVAWAEPLALDEVKAVGKALGCSINDVLVSMAAGAVRDYLDGKGDALPESIRAIIPVNLRAAGEGRSLGNQFGLVFLELPVGIEHPLERLYEVRRRMQALKGSYQPLIAYALLGTVGYGPRVLQDQVTQFLGASASAVITNVPGPQHALYFAGRRIAALDFWVPQSGGIGIGMSILSYDGRIQFGVMSDAGLVPDPQRVVARFGEEFDKLMWLTLMSPWEAGPDRPIAHGVPAKAGTSSKRRKKKSVAPIPKRFRNL